MRRHICPAKVELHYFTASDIDWLSMV